MQFMIDFAREDKDFNNLLKFTSEYRAVQGVVLDIDRVWLRAWYLRQRHGEIPRSYMWWPPGENAALQFPNTPLQRSDVDSWRPGFWSDWQARHGDKKERSPWVARVCLRPRRIAPTETNTQATADTPSDRLPDLSQMQEIVPNIRVVLETRSVARLASDPRRIYRPLMGGISIGQGPAKYGTLGLTLSDASGNCFGLTCSHVVMPTISVDQPAQFDGAHNAIGILHSATTLESCLESDPCNPWSSVTSHELDLALIKLTPGIPFSPSQILDIGSIRGVTRRASMSTGQAVEMTGRTSAFLSLQIGGLATWYRMEGPDHSFFCFKNLFEIESPYGAIPAVKLGDSGAAICTAGPDGKEWCGMVVGADMYKGFALYAETAKAWIDRTEPGLKIF